MNVTLFEVREETLVQMYGKFCELQDDLETLDPEQAVQRLDIEERYYSLKSDLKQIIKVRQALSESKNVNIQHSPSQQMERKKNVMLPKLSIPIFSGELAEWTAFWNLFTALVMNNSEIQNVEKFIHLKSLLSSEPLDLINSLTLTNDNFLIAVNILEDRYDNKILIINDHIKNLIDPSHIIKGNAHSLRIFLTHIKKHLKSLENLNVPVKEWDLILLYLFLQKLDFNTRKDFEFARNSSELPTIDEFCEFLAQRCVDLENANPHPHMSSHSVNDNKRFTTRLAHHVHTNASTYDQNVPHYKRNAMEKCVVCKAPDHNIYKCTEFRNLTHSQKSQLIQRNKLCFNCFGSKHIKTDCTSRGCTICQQRHHTLLHKHESSNTPSPHSKNPRVEPPQQVSPSTQVAQSPAEPRL